MHILGYFHGIDPAAGLVHDGELVAYVEEERLIRWKHADGRFPIRAIDFCLRQAGISLGDLDCFAYGWDAPRYANGEMADFYEHVNQRYPPDADTRAWQRRNCGWFSPDSLASRLRSELVKFFGVRSVPPLRFYPHHKSHACTAFYWSPFDEALVFTIDGSGDHQCATLWHGKGATLEFLHEVPIPHSLGWLYAAMTEFLGFDAYDGEYKVMGLAAYGRPNETFRAALKQIVGEGPNGGHEVDPRYIHHGPHSFSGRFTDHLVELLGMPPRFGPHKLTRDHEDLAFEMQRLLEETVLRLLSVWQEKTGLCNLCIAGGVGLNVKMNSRVRKSGLFDEIFIFPMPSDSATGVGAALALWVDQTHKRPPPLEHVYLGPGFSDEQIETQLRSCGLAYRTPRDLADDVAGLLAEGKVVGWFQGRLEGGPRALGARSILADPRSVDARDRVNAAIKFREYWRPFCPSLSVESASRFLQRSAPAPFMILAFDATQEAAERVPGVVHVDGTMRVQTVSAATNPRYHALLSAFERRTGVPVLLNTSFNIKGEPIVCSPRDALRTFWSTGIDALAIGSFVVEKPVAPARIAPEEVIR